MSYLFPVDDIAPCSLPAATALSHAALTGDLDTVKSIWEIFAEDLCECVGVFSLSNRTNFITRRPPAGRAFGERGALFPIFDPEGLSIITDTIIPRWEGRPGSIGIDYCVSVDTNFASFLRCKAVGKQSSLNEAGMEALQFLCENKFNFDAFPYYFENLGKDMLELPQFSETVHAVSSIPYLHADYLKRGVWKVPHSERKRIKRRSQSLLRFFRKDDYFTQMIQSARGLQMFSRAYLLKAYICTRTILDRRECWKTVLEFVHSKLGMLSPHNLHFCKLILSGGSGNQFIQKMVNPSKNLLSTIRSSAWDIALCETLIKLSVEHTRHRRRVHLPYLLSFDRPWHEMLSAFRNQGILINLRTGCYHVFGPFFVENSQDDLLRPYANSQAYAERLPVFSKLKSNPALLDAIITDLENEALELQ